MTSAIPEPSRPSLQNNPDEQLAYENPPPDFQAIAAFARGRPGRSELHRLTGPRR